jgi:hypothetical protein
MLIAADVLSGLLVFVFGGGAAGKLLGAKSQARLPNACTYAGGVTASSALRRRLRPSACSRGSQRRRWAPPLPSVS